MSVRSSSRKCAVAHPHPRREPAEDLRVRQRLAQRRDRRPVERRVVMAVREVQVPVLELCRRGQHDVRPVRGVGLEVLEHHGEQILAREPAQHRVAIRRDRGRIAVVDDERPHRRTADAGVALRERLAEPDHVDRARWRAEIGPLERRAVEREVRRRGELHAAAGAAPVARDRRQAGDVAHGHPAAGMALQPVVHADERRLRASVLLAERRRSSPPAGRSPPTCAPASTPPRARAAPRGRACTARGSRGPRARARRARASSRARARRPCRAGSGSTRRTARRCACGSDRCR